MRQMNHDSNYYCGGSEEIDEETEKLVREDRRWNKNDEVKDELPYCLPDGFVDIF